MTLTNTLARRTIGASLIESNRLEEAFVLWHAEFADNAPAALAALTALSRQATRDGRHDFAGACDAMHTALRWGSRWYPAALPERHLPAQESMLCTAKLRHDVMQFNYLHDLGVLGDEFPPFIARYKLIADQLEAEHLNRRELMTAAEQDQIGGVYNRIVHIRPTPRMEQPFSTLWCGDEVEASYRGHAPGIVVIDDFLSPRALEELRRFCLQSTVWSSLRYSHGRLGAMYHDGFNCPLLVQVAQGLREALPHLLGERHALTQMWAYKYPPILPGDDIHADFAAINVNFWITPDAANLDPVSGGMFIYDVEAPPEWNFERYNRHPESIRQYLAEVGARARYIPYRQNRAVIFNSDLFHGTAACTFRDDYESRRINVTMLYGHRRDDVLHRTPPRADRSPAESNAFAAWRSAALRRPYR